jgi:sugar phosphate isomerase/epimerase
MSPATTLVISVATSSTVAAILTGILSGRNERKKLLHESRRVLAGDFGGEAMNALAALRHYKPTTRAGHRNDTLHIDPSLRANRAEAVRDAIDRLRPMRGRIWVTFPGRTGKGGRATRQPHTTADWAEQVIICLRKAEETCNRFWTACEHDPSNRPALESKLEVAYDEAKNATWAALDAFALSAAEWLEQSFFLPRRP